jgi:ankyrin repeat protein
LQVLKLKVTKNIIFYVDLNPPNESEFSALIEAIKVPTFESNFIAELVINNSSILQFHSSKSRMTPLHVLCMVRSDEFLIDLFVSNKADVNAQDSRLKTPLHYAMHTVLTFP